MEVKNESKIFFRHSQFLEILDENKYVSIRDMAYKLEVTEMTVRRDYLQLKEVTDINMVNGILIRDSEETNKDKYHVLLAQDRYVKEKISIGKYAASLIMPGDIVAIDTGTTTVQIAKHLSKVQDVTFLCYALNILDELRKKTVKNIIFGGGVYKTDTQVFESLETVLLLNRLRTVKAFVSAGGVSSSLGVTCEREYEVPLKKAIMSSSLEKILVFDSSKYNKIRQSYFADLSDFDHIICDNLVCDELVTYCSENNIKLTLVKAD